MRPRIVGITLTRARAPIALSEGEELHLRREGPRVRSEAVQDIVLWSPLER